MLVVFALALGVTDYCARAVDALDWKPGLVCPAGTWRTAFLMRHRSGAHLACVDKETRKRRGPYIAIDCAGVVLARGTLTDGQPTFMSREDHCSEAQDETERLACPQGTSYNRIVVDDGVVHQCLNATTAQPEGPYLERDCSGKERARGTMKNGLLALDSVAPEPAPASVPEPAAPPPYAEIRPPSEHAHLQLAFDVTLGAAVNLVKDASTTTFSLGYRQEIFITPTQRPVALSFYAEVLTQKKFADVLAGGGLQLRVLARLISIVPSLGVDARWDNQRWGTSLAVGLFVGLHGNSGLVALPAGFRVELRQRVTPDRETALLFLLQVDALWPIFLPLMMLGAGKAWFPHG